jgi:hypothetical protein
MAENLLQYAAQVLNLARRGVVEVFSAENLLFEVLRFTDIGEADAYEYNREASLGGIGFRALNADYAAAAKTTGVINPVIERTAILGGVVEIDRQRAASDAYRANKVAMKAKAAARYYVKNFVKGSTATAAGAAGFDGVYTRLTGANVKYAGTNGGVMSLDEVQELIDFVPGPAARKRLLMGAAMRRRLASKIRAEGATIINLVDWEGPLAPKSFSGVPILIPGDDESGAEIMAFNETRGSSNVTGSILCVAFGENDEEACVGIAKRAAQGPFEIEDQGTHGVTRKILVEGRLGLTLHHPKTAKRYAGILDANS